MCIRDSSDSDSGSNCDSGSEHKVPVVPTQYHEMTSHHDSNHHYNNLVMEQHHKQELPDTGYDVANNGTLFGGILAALGSLLLVGSKRRSKKY